MVETARMPARVREKKKRARAHHNRAREARHEEGV